MLRRSRWRTDAPDQERRIGSNPKEEPIQDPAEEDAATRLAAPVRSVPAACWRQARFSARAAAA
jgi:hypothetical protein